MGKKPDWKRAQTQNLCLWNRYPSLISLAAVQPHPPHTCPLHPPNLHISLTRNMRAESAVPSRTTIHPHPFAHPLLNLQLFLHHTPHSNGSKTPPCLTRPRPYLGSRTFRNPHADAHRALAFPWSEFPGQTASSPF